MGYVSIYAQWGRIDEALRWLQAAYDHHDANLIDMRAIWLYDPLRDTPQFKEIERRLNLPPV